MNDKNKTERRTEMDGQIRFEEVDMSEKLEKANVGYEKNNKGNIKIIVIPDTSRRWIEAVLNNDENSTDDELREYFLKNGAIKSDVDKALAQREKCLTDFHYKLKI